MTQPQRRRMDALANDCRRAGRALVDEAFFTSVTENEREMLRRAAEMICDAVMMLDAVSALYDPELPAVAMPETAPAEQSVPAAAPAATPEPDAGEADENESSVEDESAP